MKSSLSAPVSPPAADRRPGESTRPGEVSPAAQRALLDVARAALAAVTGCAPRSALREVLHPARSVADLDTTADLDALPDLEWPAAVFVTLTEAGVLRGCMGGLEAERPVREAVVAAAVSAALRDPRFAPVTAEELPQIHIEVSVLAPPVPLEDPADFQPGIDGVIVERDRHVALLLPEVATEFGWGAPEMLDTVCRKAGLPRDTWRDPKTRLFAFRTARFGGPSVAPTDRCRGS